MRRFAVNSLGTTLLLAGVAAMVFATFFYLFIYYFTGDANLLDADYELIGFTLATFFGGVGLTLLGARCLWTRMTKPVTWAIISAPLVAVALSIWIGGEFPNPATSNVAAIFATILPFAIVLFVGWSQAQRRAMVHASA